MLSPNAEWMMLSKHKNKSNEKPVPFVVIRSCGDRSSVKDNLVFHEILLTRGEDSSICHEQIPCDLSVRDHDKELISHPDGEQWPIFLCPRVKCTFGILAKESIAGEWTGRDRVSIFVDDIPAEEIRKEGQEGSC